MSVQFHSQTLSPHIGFYQKKEKKNILRLQSWTSRTNEWHHGSYIHPSNFYIVCVSETL